MKIETIKNSIFACDIEPSAVDIAKLRLWLTIVIEDEPTADKFSFKPKPLPNLDNNIICGNSLIDEFEGVPLIKTSKFLKNQQKGETSLLQTDFDVNLLNIISWQDKLFFETNHDKKEEIRRHIRNLYNETVIKQIGGEKSALAKAYEVAAQKKSLPFVLWQLYFPTVFKNNGGFDIIIGNPPYIGEEGHKELFREIATTNFGKKYHTGKMDFWYFFLSKSIELLKSSGFLSFIAPNNWMTTAGGKNMRSHIAKETTIKSFITFNNVMIFENASQQTMIFIIEKKSARQLYKFKYKEVGNRNLNGQELTEFLNGAKIGTAYETNYNPTENIDGRPIQFLNETVTELIEKIKGGLKIFLDKDEMINGIHPHHGFVTKKMLKFLSPQSKVGDGIFILSLEEIEQMDIPNNERTLLKPYYNSENVGRYYFNADNHYEIIYTTSEFKNAKLMEPYPILKKHLDAYVDVITSDNRPYGLSRARKEKFFENPKIVSLRKCAVPTFSYIDKSAYFTAEWYCIMTDRVNMKYLTCLLNSSLIKFWLLKMGKIQGNIFQVDKAPLENIPIQVPDLESENQIIELYNLITAAKKMNRYADTTGFELEVDKIIYKLYGLTEEEINFIKNFELEIRIGTDETE